MVSGAANEYSVAVRETTFGAAIAEFGPGVLSFGEQAEAVTEAIQRHPQAQYFTDNLHHSDRTA
jgi:hypothetical protein